MEKEEILNAIRESARVNNGTPFGKERFAREMKISQYAINKYWSRYSDLLIEAGFQPNSMSSAYDEKFLLKCLVGLIHEIKKFPTGAELIGKSAKNPEFPSRNAFDRLGTKEQKLKKFLNTLMNLAIHTPLNYVMKFWILFQKKKNLSLKPPTLKPKEKFIYLNQGDFTR